MNQIFAMEVVTHQKAHGNQIPRCFEDVCDPTRVPINEIKDIEVEMTIIDGEAVWEKRS